MAVTICIIALLVVRPCGLVGAYRCFGIICSLSLQGQPTVSIFKVLKIENFVCNVDIHL
jgi:hypothetical protein